MLFFGFRSRNMIGEDSYTNAEIKCGISVLKSIKRWPNLSLKEFGTSLSSRNTLVAALISTYGKPKLRKKGSSTSGVSFLYDADAMTSAFFGSSKDSKWSFPVTCMFLQNIST